MTLSSVKRRERRLASPSSICIALMLSAILGVYTSFALAEEIPLVSPPISRGSTDVPYPADGKGDAVVILELVVEKDGTVSNARVIEGAEPFAEHARHAVL